MCRLFVLSFTLLSCAAAGLAQAPKSASPTQSLASPSPAVQDSQECTEAKATAMRLEARLKDWPALARYRDDNAKVAAPRLKKGSASFSWATR